jgi:hypothetical protein
MGDYQITSIARRGKQNNQSPVEAQTNEQSPIEVNNTDLLTIIITLGFIIKMTSKI